MASKSPLLRKQALDALLETMGTDSYESLGGHGMTDGKPSATPEDKGTEFESLHTTPVVIPANDLVAPPPDSPADAEFFKEGEPDGEVIRASGAIPARVAWRVPKSNDPKPMSGYGAGDRDKDKKEPEPHKYRGYADGSACYECGQKRDAAIHQHKESSVKTAHGSYPDPGPEGYDSEHEAHVRAEAKQWSQYAEEDDNKDDIKPYDPSGNYLCGTCDMRRGSAACARVEGEISFETGSCKLYHIGEPESDPPMKKPFSKEEVKYGEHAGGFGCHRCEYSSEAKEADADGRKGWCAFWGMHVDSNACCAEWDEDEEKDKAAEEENKKVEEIQKNAFEEDVMLMLGSTYPGTQIRAHWNTPPYRYRQARERLAAMGMMYHVTRTSAVPQIQKKGIVQTFQSNWDQGTSGKRYGEGEIFAFTNPSDAVKWAGKMGWEHYKSMGDGKISIVLFTPTKDQKWEVDTNDPVSQLGAKGKWMKMVGRVAPEQIKKIVPVDQEMIRAVVADKPVKLAFNARNEFESLDRKWKLFKDSLNRDTLTLDDMKVKAEQAIGFAEKLKALKPDNRALFEDVGVTFKNTTDNLIHGMRALDKIPGIVDELQSEWAHRSYYNEYTLKDFFMNAIYDIQTGFHNLGVEYYYLDAPRDEQGKVIHGSTKSYGMGTPIGGTPNGGALEDLEEDEDINDKLNLTSALEKVSSMKSIAWWWKTARPTEQKIQMLQKQFNLTPEQIELCINADPSPQQKDFVAWIAKFYAKKQIALPEDTEKLKKQLGLFQKLKRSPQFQGNKDVQTYDPATLFKTIEDNQNAVSKKEQQRRQVIEGSEVVVDDGSLVIYKVWEPAALMQLSGGTNWCTAHNSHSSRYLKQGPSYVFFYNDSAFAQLHPPSDQLMNRADECMIEDLNDSTGETIAKFINDPIALRGLQDLAKKQPDVAKWVKENAVDSGTIEEILGRKMQEEQAQGDTNREMTVRHALQTNMPLPPEQEARLADQVQDIRLLWKYAVKFHEGERWKPLELAVLQEPSGANVVRYTEEFLGSKRWPAAEKLLLNNAFNDARAMEHAIGYAEAIIKKRWPELEAKFHVAQATPTSASGSAEYAIKILKKRWTEAVRGAKGKKGTVHEEEIIKVNPRAYNEYAEHFIPNELWDKFKQVLQDRTGLSRANFRPDKDLWIVNEWDDLAECVRSIGNTEADDAMDYALDESAPEGTTRNHDLPDADDMAKEIAPQLSYAAMRRIGQSLMEEEGDMVERWARQNRIQDVDFTDPQQLYSVLMYLEPTDCSVWKNIRKSFEEGKEARFRSRRIGDLEYALDNDLYERGEDRKGNPLFTELRYGPDFKTNFGGDWRIKPVYEVLDRASALRMLNDYGEEDEDNQTDIDISDGQLELWVMEPDYSGDDDEGNEESYELMDRWYTEGLPRETDERQMPLQFASSLLKKNAIVQMHETPTMLPPRDDMRRHIDQTEQDQIDQSVMQGVTPNQPPQQRRPKRKQQIDPRTNPNGESNFDPITQTQMQNPAQMNPYLTNPALQIPMNAAMEGEILPKRMGNWKLWIFPKDQVRYGQYGEIARPIPEDTKMYYVGDKKKALDILNQDYGPLTTAQEDMILSRGALDLDDVVIRVTNVDYTKPIVLPKRTLTSAREPRVGDKIWNMYDWTQSGSIRKILPMGMYLVRWHNGPHAGETVEVQGTGILGNDVMEMIKDKQQGMDFGKGGITASGESQLVQEALTLENEAYQAFLKQDYLQQEAHERRITMRDLWEDMKDEFMAEFFQIPYRSDRDNKVGPEFKREGSCPKCKKANTQEVVDPRQQATKLAECLDCGAFYDF